MSNSTTLNQKILLSGTFRVELNQDAVILIAKLLEENKIKIFLSEKDASVINDKNDLTVSEMLSLYSSAKNIKNLTINAYVSAFRNFFNRVGGFDLRYWKDIKVSEISEKVIEKFNVTSSCDYQYLTRINILFNWLVKEEIIDTNPCTKYFSKLKKFPQDVRAALHCEEWIDVVEAKKILSDFFKKIRTILNECFYRFLVLHFILGTRITETFNYIDKVRDITYDDSNVLNSVFIETKTTKKGSGADFRIPVPKFIYEFIVNDNDFYSSRKFVTIASTLRKILVESFKNQFCLHGTRAIFRTVIDFIDKDQTIGKDEKEAYINHVTDNNVQRRYHRNDYLIARLRIMCMYASFIYECSDLAEYKSNIQTYVLMVNDRLNRKLISDDSLL